jgi:nucleotide-binding universal stress UspA family protein
VSYDVASPSQDAVKAATALARETGAELRLVAIYDAPAPTAPPGAPAARDGRRAAAVAKLLAVADDADLLLLDARERGGMRRRLAGACEEVARAAACPVLVIPSSAPSDGHVRTPGGDYTSA